MGKIRQLREDILLGNNSQDKVYPITYAKAVYMDSGKTTQEEIKSIEGGEALEDNSINTRHIEDNAVTTNKIIEGAITSDKLGDNSVETSKIKNEAITNDKMAQDSINTEQVIDESIANSKLAKNSVSTEKLQNNSVTNNKIAKDSITKDKFDPELRKTLDAAIGLPDDLITMIQDVDKNLNKLNDTVYPIVLEFTINPNVSTMKTDVVYSVRSDNEYLVPDTLSITKRINDEVETILTNYPTSNSSLATLIQGAREIFKFTVTKQGRTSKSTSQTKYLCYYGGNAESTITTEILNTLNKVSSTGVSFNPKVTTKDNDYIWLVVPSYLSINRVTSAGFDVTLATPQTITNTLGSFKAYRTANPLTEATWSLVIS